MMQWISVLTRLGSAGRRRDQVQRLAALAVVMMLLAAGCSRLDISGSRPANQPPDLILANIPAGGTEFSANPLVFWYGTDIDGRIIRYDYAVIPESTVKRFLEEEGCGGENLPDAERFILCAPDEAFGWISIFVDSTTDQLPTQQRVKLFAAFDTLDCDSQSVFVYDTTGPVDTAYFVSEPVNCVSKTIPQYMFVRAIDDLDSSSQIKYRSYLRRNHWPETAIADAFDLQSRIGEFFSLPALSTTYRGIPVTWRGSDRSDFLRDEPPLEFHWRVYGPYTSKPRLEDTLMESGVPRRPVQESSSGDPRKGVWVTDTLTSLYDLWHDYDMEFGPSDTTRLAHFGLVVSSRDDAFSVDPSPSFVPFRAIDPHFERDILLLADGDYGQGTWATPTCSPDQPLDPKCNHEFLVRLAQAAAEVSTNPNWTWEFDKDWLEFNKQNGSTDSCNVGGCALYNQCSRPRCAPNGPPLYELARHRLVIYSQDDIDSPIRGSDQVENRLQTYLNIGGMIWLIDRVPFLAKVEVGQKAGPIVKDFTDPTRSTVGRFPRFYFDMEGLWFPGWMSGLDRVNPPASKSDDEFVGADLIAGDYRGYPYPERLDFDSVHVNASYVLTFRVVLGSKEPPQSIIGVPAVPYAIRGSKSRGLYKFSSYRPEQNNADGAIVGMRFVGPDRSNPKFKTAWFGCPLYFLKEEHAFELARAMTDWFLNQPLEVQ